MLLQRRRESENLISTNHDDDDFYEEQEQRIFTSPLSIVVTNSGLTEQKQPTFPEPMSALTLGGWIHDFDVVNMNDTESCGKRKRNDDLFEYDEENMSFFDYKDEEIDEDWECLFEEQQTKKMKIEQMISTQYEIANDVWTFNIFVFLEWDELFALRRVCKNWYSIIKHVPAKLTACMHNPTYFRGFLENLNPYYHNLTEITLMKYDVTKIRCHRLRNAARIIFLSQPNLQKLDLQSGCKIGREEAQSLTLVTKPHLKEILIPNNEVDDTICELICNGNTPAIEYADLSMNFLSSSSCEFISRWKHLKYLDLSYNLLSPLACQFLSSLSELTELKLAGCGIGDQGCEYLSRTPDQLSQLSKLDVSSNEITALGCKHLSKLTSITWLDISFNTITHEGITHLGGMTQLIALHAADTSLGASGVAALSRIDALRNNLTELNLTKNNICNEGCEYFKNFNKLKVLRLGLNRIGQLGCKHLSEITFNDLQLLDLHYNSIGVKGTCFLSRNSFPSLRELNICSNSIHNPQCPCFKNAAFPNLQSLYINGNNITETYLNDIKQTHPQLKTDVQISQEVFNFNPRTYFTNKTERGAHPVR
ncbi:hypothetical protein FDP41_001358 [Naegleria fowleri]|uniref:F-box domain-containing protein n=1 Tax=Naegleria fowleri TaxID=5763 RepID=A0A6A5C1E0_NAEFO|nr:uncharacterized protein FDP41_001358 [Naegleria fowleri]KAF0979690.1 hypothetical protein FDP41_001358 [Naegleria fowleri]